MIEKNTHELLNTINNKLDLAISYFNNQFNEFEIRKMKKIFFNNILENMNKVSYPLLEYYCKYSLSNLYSTLCYPGNKVYILDNLKHKHFSLNQELYDKNKLYNIQLNLGFNKRAENTQRDINLLKYKIHQINKVSLYNQNLYKE